MHKKQIMKNIFPTVVILIALAFSTTSCMNADEIRLRALAFDPSMAVKITEAVTPENLGKIHKLSTKEFRKVIAENIGVLVDIRTPEAYEVGHLEGAINIDFKARTFPSYISALDKNKPVLIYCRSGNRSGKAGKIMQALGFTEIYDLAKGFKTWEGKKLPVTTDLVKANTKLQAQLEKNTPKIETLAHLGKTYEVEVAKFEALLKEGNVTLLDVRTPKEFAEGHIEGAININWKDRHFSENILTTITDEKPVAIYANTGNRSTRAMFAMQAIGFTKIYHLAQGIKSWEAANKPLIILKVEGDPLHLDAINFNNAILSQVGKLVDVRTAKEYDDYHIPKAINIDFKNKNFETEFAKLDKEEPVLIYCRSGRRSEGAAKVLKKMGFSVYNLNNGIKDWKAKGMKVVGANVNTTDVGEEGC